jgi:hypothetical protein
VRQTGVVVDVKTVSWVVFLRQEAEAMLRYAEDVVLLLAGTMPFIFQEV